MGFRSARRRRHTLLTGLSLLCLAPAAAHAGVLLNDSFTDGDRTSTSLPTDSPVWIGQSTGNGSNAVTPGHLNFALPSNSLKFWTYFTSDHAAPDANQPHNAVTSLGVGDSLTASVTFTVTGLNTTAQTGKNFRMGLFLDPSDARVQSDTNSDGGGSTAPWTDALGYAVELPLTIQSNSSPFQIVKRTTSNSSLLGSSGALTNAPTGGAQYTMADNTHYTLQLTLTELTASDMQVSVSLLQGTTLLASQTVDDLGATFGGNAVPASLTGSQSTYTHFDQLFFRNSDNSQAATLDITNFNVTLTPAPEPASASLLALAASASLAARRRRPSQA